MLRGCQRGLWVVALLAPWLGACCPQGILPGKVACVADGDCPTGLVCLGALCQLPDAGTGGVGGSGGSTSGSSTGGSTTTRGTSGSGTTGGSTTTQGSSTSSGGSTGGKLVPCTTDAECGDGGYCPLPYLDCTEDPALDYVSDAGYCHRDCDNDNCSCTNDADCPGGGCSSGACLANGASCALAPNCPTNCPPSNDLAEFVCPVCLCPDEADCQTTPFCNGLAAPCSVTGGCGAGACCSDLGCNGTQCCIPITSTETCTTPTDGGYPCTTDCDCPCCEDGVYATCNVGACTNSCTVLPPGYCNIQAIDAGCFELPCTGPGTSCCGTGVCQCPAPGACVCM